MAKAPPPVKWHAWDRDPKTGERARCAWCGKSWLKWTPIPRVCVEEMKA